MKKTSGKQQVVLNVCGSSDCKKRGAKKVGKALKKELKARGLDKKVLVQKSGCMDRCKCGPNVMVFPPGEWLSEVDPNDVAAICERVESVLKG